MVKTFQILNINQDKLRARIVAHIIYKYFINKMNMQNVMTFCNQYLMLKVLESSHPVNGKYRYNQDQVDKHTKITRGHKFQNPQKKYINESSNLRKQETCTQNKLKSKKKNFQTHQKTTKNIATKQQQYIQYRPTNQINTKKEVDHGYVPIQQLLMQLQTNKMNHYDNNFVSFGSNNLKKTSFQPLNLEKNIFPINDYRAEKSWMFQRQKNFNSTTFISNKSQQFFESPIRQFKDKITPSYYVPASRSRSPLTTSNSCNNLSLSPQNRSVVGDSSLKKRKKSQRSFYVPPNNNSNQKQNLQISRCTSSNNIISKFERQIFDQANEVNRAQKSQTEKSKAEETNYQTRTNKRQGSSIIKQLEEYSAIQFENGVRQSLSFLSEARGPLKPITIQLKK